MSYGLHADLFGEVEKDIEKGLYEQAEERLKNIHGRRLTKDEKFFARILQADICSQSGRFPEALDIQKKLLLKKTSDPLLKEAVFHSHAYTLGYCGIISESCRFFEKAGELAKRRCDISRYYASVLGTIDIEFHDYNYDRFDSDQNKSLLYKICVVLEEIGTGEEFAEKELYVGLFSFRKAVLLWLNGDYADAKLFFEVTQQFSKTFFSVWALFGIVHCMHKLGEKAHLRKHIKELKAEERKPAWKKTAMKYWPVALLLGKTWELLKEEKKAHDFYRKILLTVRDGYTNRHPVTAEYAAFITNYFYPVYRETLRYFLDVRHKYRYALNRAEMFRARFLTEEYKRHHGKKRSDEVLSLNARIDAIGDQLAGIFHDDVSILYCFDHRDSGILLLSKNLCVGYKAYTIAGDDYRRLKDIATLPQCTGAVVDSASSILGNMLAAVKTSRLIVIPHGIFNSVPFHALKLGGEPLLRQTLVNYWPSLQMAALGETGRRHIPQSTLFIGTRIDPGSEREIEQLVAAAGKTCVLYDPRLPVLTKALEHGGGITHFVTHGSLQPDGDDLTVMKFNWGSFKLSAISARLSAVSPILVLNICYGGYLHHDSAEFLEGLPVTLLQKKAQCLLLSSRRVEQETSRLFYERFYKHLFSGLTLGEAYRKAVLKADNMERMLANAPAIMGTCDIKISRRE